MQQNDKHMWNAKAILLMGGKGCRFNDPLPKQFHRLSGKKIYLHTLETLLKSRLFNEYLLVVPLEWIDTVKQDLTSYSNEKIRVVEGGDSRQASSYAGLLACGKDTDIVLIHDAVRPFVTEKILRENLQYAAEYGAVDTCIASADTIVYSEDRAFITNIPPRINYYRGQTPQTFRYELILEAHENALKNNFSEITDDCRLVKELGLPVNIVEGSETNIKITSPVDLHIAEYLIQSRAVETFEGEYLEGLEGKKYILVGATGGIGKEIAALLSKEKAKVIPLSRSSELSLNLMHLNSVEEVFNEIHEKEGKVDGLINCAGVLYAKRLMDLSEEEINEMLQVNFASVVKCCKSAYLKDGAHIINMASSSYNLGRKESTIYSATKSALVNFTQGLAEELPHYFINAVAPQRTLTNMRLNNFPKEETKDLVCPSTVARKVIEILKRKDVTGMTYLVRKVVET